MLALWCQAVEWLQTKSSTQVREAREAVTRAIETMARELRETGATTRWYVLTQFSATVTCDQCARMQARFANADEGVRAVCRDVNGPLLEVLAKKIGYHDSSCVDLFRLGCILIGLLDKSGNGVPPKPRQTEMLAQEAGRGEGRPRGIPRDAH